MILIKHMLVMQTSRRGQTMKGHLSISISGRNYPNLQVSVTNRQRHNLRTILLDLSPMTMNLLYVTKRSMQWTTTCLDLSFGRCQVSIFEVLLFQVGDYIF